jgi:tryptophan synthase alpha subunit
MVSDQADPSVTEQEAHKAELIYADAWEMIERAHRSTWNQRTRDMAETYLKVLVYNEDHSEKLRVVLLTLNQRVCAKVERSFVRSYIRHRGCSLVIRTMPYKRRDAIRIHYKAACIMEEERLKQLRRQG